MSIGLLMDSNTIADNILYSCSVAVCVLLLFIGILNIKRAHEGKQKSKRLKLIRTMAVVCGLFQLQCQLGYFINNVLLLQIAWICWIPISLLALTMLSIKVSQSYVDIASFQQPTKHVRLKVAAYGMWFLTSMVDESGSLLGFVSTQASTHVWQYFLYALWKYLAVGTLSIVIYEVAQVRMTVKRCMIQSQVDIGDCFHEVETMRMKKGLRKMLFMILSLVALNACLLLDGTFEFILFAENIRLPVDQQVNIYLTRTPAISAVLIYLPIWSFIQLFLIIYTWPVKVPTADMVKQSSNMYASERDENSISGSCHSWASSMCSHSDCCQHSQIHNHEGNDGQTAKKNKGVANNAMDAEDDGTIIVTTDDIPQQQQCGDDDDKRKKKKKKSKNKLEIEITSVSPRSPTATVTPTTPATDTHLDLCKSSPQASSPIHYRIGNNARKLSPVASTTRTLTSTTSDDRGEFTMSNINSKTNLFESTATTATLEMDTSCNNLSTIAVGRPSVSSFPSSGYSTP